MEIIFNLELHLTGFGAVIMLLLALFGSLTILFFILKLIARIK
jgi:hypothetical protein